MRRTSCLTTIVNWNPFKRRVQFDVIRRDRCLMSLDEWQASPGLVKIAQNHLNHPEMRLMLDVLRNEHVNQRFYADDVSAHVRVVAQARSEGYTQCLASFEALGKFIGKAELGEETFGAIAMPQEKEEA